MNAPVIKEVAHLARLEQEIAATYDVAAGKLGDDPVALSAHEHAERHRKTADELTRYITDAGADIPPPIEGPEPIGLEPDAQHVLHLHEHDEILAAMRAAAREVEHAYDRALRSADADAELRDWLGALRAMTTGEQMELARYRQVTASPELR